MAGRRRGRYPPEYGERSDELTTEARKETRRLKREVNRLGMERDILERAAAWFTRESGSIPGAHGRAMARYILPRALGGVFALNTFLGIPAALFGGPVAFGLVSMVGCVGLGIWFGRDLKARRRLAMFPFEKEIPRET